MGNGLNLPLCMNQYSNSLLLFSVDTELSAVCGSSIYHVSFILLDDYFSDWLEADSYAANAQNTLFTLLVVVS